MTREEFLQSGRGSVFALNVPDMWLVRHGIFGYIVTTLEGWSGSHNPEAIRIVAEKTGTTSEYLTSWWLNNGTVCDAHTTTEECVDWSFKIADRDGCADENDIYYITGEITSPEDVSTISASSIFSVSLEKAETVDLRDLKDGEMLVSIRIPMKPNRQLSMAETSSLKEELEALGCDIQTTVSLICWLCFTMVRPDALSKERLEQVKSVALKYGLKSWDCKNSLPCTKISVFVKNRCLGKSRCKDLAHKLRCLLAYEMKLRMPRSLTREPFISILSRSCKTWSAIKTLRVPALATHKNVRDQLLKECESLTSLSMTVGHLSDVRVFEIDAAIFTPSLSPDRVNNCISALMACGNTIGLSTKLDDILLHLATL